MSGKGWGLLMWRLRGITFERSNAFAREIRILHADSRMEYSSASSLLVYPWLFLYRSSQSPPDVEAAWDRFLERQRDNSTGSPPGGASRLKPVWKDVLQTFYVKMTFFEKLAFQVIWRVVF